MRKKLDGLQDVMFFVHRKKVASASEGFSELSGSKTAEVKVSTKRLG